jgi:threo-3-hydroxy-L-aspartate ammonia-lyase
MSDHESGAAIGLADIEAAAARLRGVAHRTPVVTSRTLDARAGAAVFLKCENLQRVGAFKFRGAYNAISQLSPEQLARGVAAYSSGNHAQAVALACREVGAPALVVVPVDVAAAKLAAILGYGAEVVTYDRHTEDRAAVCQRLADERGLTIIAPFEHPQVIAGQGTTALELLEEVPDCDSLAVPVSGGGLVAGCAIAATALRPGIAMIGVEPESGDDTRRSLAAGHPVSVPQPDTIADGLRSTSPGALTFSINSRLLKDVVLVSDDEIRAAMRFAFERLKLVLEPSGATGLAAVLAGRVPGGRIGVVLSGGNVDAARFAELIGGAQPSP